MRTIPNVLGCSISTPSPQSEYESRRAGHAAAIALLETRERISGRLRIVAFLAVVVPFLVFPIESLEFAASVSVATFIFIAFIRWHRRVLRNLARSRRAERYFGRGLARLSDTWIGQGPPGERYADVAHPYSSDLDIFGRGSLFQYLCEAHTPGGQDTLANWLMAPAEPSAIRDRQAAVAELRSNVELREALGVLGNPDQPELTTRALLSWPAGPPVLTGWLWPIVAIVLGVLGIAGIVVWAGFELGPSPLLLIVIIEILVLARHWGKIREVTGDARTMLLELEAFLPVLRLVEAQRFQSPELQAISTALTSEGELPSRRVARLASLLDAWDTARRNQFTLPLGIVLMVPTHLAYAIDRWRLREGRYVRAWLDAVGRFEALCSFSAFAFEHPEYPFAEIVDKGPLCDAMELAHPLLPASKRIANDVALGSEPGLLLISGSNMSGKSTLMRAVGLNAVLALAGAPVCASGLRVSVVSVATAMRQGDSLHEGVSAFYAEIRRLQVIRELTVGPLPVLFLLDEILRGTNSHDRRVGAEAVIAILMKNGGFGIVSTHDLTLTEIVDRLGSRAVNVHFEDQLVDGKMSFDYKLRPGVVPRGNGLVLLRLLGFEV